MRHRSSMESTPGHVTAVFQAANDLIAGAAQQGEVEFICECADPTCLDSVPMSVEERDDRRRLGLAVVVPGHNAGPDRPPVRTLVRA